MIPVKQMIQKFLSLFGWRLSRLEQHLFSQEGQRIIWRVFYRNGCLLCFKGDIIAKEILEGRGFEEQLLGILKGCKDSSRPDVIEVGANIGTTFVTIAREFPNLAFHCVEPVPAFFDLLKRNAENYKATNAKLYNLALGATSNDTLKIHTLLGTAGAIKRFDGYVAETVQTESKTMDELFGHTNPYLVKIDVDGFEMEVLKGGKNLLSQKKPLLYLEYDSKIIRRMGNSPKEFADVLRSYGYENIRIWDTFDQWVGDVQSFEELEAIAGQLHFHANILLAPRGVDFPPR